MFIYYHFLQHCGDVDYEMRNNYTISKSKELIPSLQHYNRRDNCMNINMVTRVYSSSYSSSFYKSIITCYTTTNIFHQSPNTSPPHLLTISFTKPFTKPSTNGPSNPHPNLNQQCLNSPSSNTHKPSQDQCPGRTGI
jgi:hypothetical protein